MAGENGAWGEWQDQLSEDDVAWLNSIYEEGQPPEDPLPQPTNARELTRTPPPPEPPAPVAAALKPDLPGRGPAGAAATPEAAYPPAAEDMTAQQVAGPRKDAARARVGFDIPAAFVHSQKAVSKRGNEYTQNRVNILPGTQLKIEGHAPDATIDATGYTFFAFNVSPQGRMCHISLDASKPVKLTKLARDENNQLIRDTAGGWVKESEVTVLPENLKAGVEAQREAWRAEHPRQQDQVMTIHKAFVTEHEYTVRGTGELRTCYWVRMPPGTTVDGKDLGNYELTAWRGSRQNVEGPDGVTTPGDLYDISLGTRQPIELRKTVLDENRKPLKGPDGENVVLEETVPAAALAAAVAQQRADYASRMQEREQTVEVGELEPEKPAPKRVNAPVPQMTGIPHSQYQAMQANKHNPAR